VACIVFRNVIGEALIVGQTKEQESDELNENEKQAQAQGQVSIFFGARSIGSLIFSYLGGAVLELISHRKIFLICSIFPLAVVIIAFYFLETKQTIDTNKSFKEDMKNIGTVLFNPKIKNL